MAKGCHLIARFLSYLTFRRVSVTGAFNDANHSTLYLYRSREGWSANWLILSRLPFDTSVLANGSRHPCWWANRAFNGAGAPDTADSAERQRFRSKGKRLLALVDDNKGQGRPFLPTAQWLSQQLINNPALVNELQIVIITHVSRHAVPIGSDQELYFHPPVPLKDLLIRANQNPVQHDWESTLTSLVEASEPDAHSKKLAWQSGLLEDVDCLDQESFHHCLQSLEQGLPTHMLSRWLQRRADQTTNHEFPATQRALYLCWKLPLCSLLLLCYCGLFLLPELAYHLVRQPLPVFFRPLLFLTVFLGMTTLLAWVSPWLLLIILLPALAGLKHRAFLTTCLSDTFFEHRAAQLDQSKIY